MNNYLWIWCLTNTILVVGLLMSLHVTRYINETAIEKVEHMEIRLNEMESLKTDTIIVNINNYIK